MFILFPRDQHKKSASVKNKEAGNSHISVKNSGRPYQAARKKRQLHSAASDQNKNTKVVPKTSHAHGQSVLRRRSYPSPHLGVILATRCAFVKEQGYVFSASGPLSP